MTFDELIAYHTRQGYSYHVFSAYAGGQRGYYASRKTWHEASRLAAKLEAATIYNEAGDAIA